MARQWYSIQAQAGKPAEISIFGDVVDAEYFAGEVGAAEFIEQLNAIDAKKINLSINSPGGSVWAGIAIANALKGHKAHVTARVEGLAASIASIIAISADHVEMAENSFMMIHEPHSMVVGEAGDMEKMADTLRKVSSTLVDIYQKKTGKPRKQIEDLMAAESWFTAEEAVEHGFADSVTEPLQVAAQLGQHKFFKTPREVVQMTAKQKSEDEIRAELRQQEQDRKTGISSLFQKFGGSQELLNKCLSDDTIDHSRAMELLMTDQLGGGQGPATDHSMGGSYRAYGTSSDFMEAASDVIAMRGGVRVADPHPSAAAGDFERMSLTDIAASCLRQRGQSTDRMTKDQVLKAALSTSDFPLILSNTANKSIAQGYAEAPAVHPALCSSREAADFKPQTLLRLSAFDSLLELGEQSEFQHADLLESAESFKIDTYGRTINISRQALVNDELSMFSTLPAEMGAAARRMESSLYWEMLTSNGGAGPIMSSGDSFFHANHGNIATGADLSTTALAEMKKLMRVQKSLGGRTYLNIQPSFLVVPPSLEQTAEEVLNSTLLPTSNVETVSWIRSLTLLVAPELEDIDPAAYYLFSAPEQLAATSMAYLQGHQSPTVEGNDEWERLASSWRVFFDFAAVAVEPAGAVYNGGSGAQAARKKKA